MEAMITQVVNNLKGKKSPALDEGIALHSSFYITAPQAKYKKTYPACVTVKHAALSCLHKLQQVYITW